VATADPDDAVGADAADEDDDEDDDDEVPDEDDVPPELEVAAPELVLLELATLELAVPAAAELCWAAAGSTTAIAAAAATLVIPAPAVTTASLALPWRLTRRALASTSAAASSVDMIDTPVHRDRLLRQPGCVTDIGNACPESLRRR
jgi:hypothetical protein